MDRRNIHWPIQVMVRPIADIDITELERLAGELSTEHAPFIAALDQDTPFILVGGCDELQLERSVTLLQNKIPNAVHVGAPQVGYRETIGRAAEVDYSHRDGTGKGSQFARVKIVLEPLDVRLDYEFENKADPHAVPTEFIPGIERGIQSVLDGGVVAEFPMIGLKISSVDGSCDEGSSALSFEVASRAAVREAARKADVALVEPVLKVVVVTPEDCAGGVIADLNSRRGLISGTDTRDNTMTIDAQVPTAGLFGYSNTLAQMAKDRASYSAQFSHYERVPST